MAAARCYGLGGPNPVRVAWYPVYASASFVQGDFLKLQGTTTGLTQAAAAGNNYTNPTSQTTWIAGRAEAPSTVADGSGTQATWVPITVADIGVWFQMPMYSGTAANAVVTLSYIGGSYGGRQVTANYPAVNIDDSSNVVWLLVNFDANDDSAWATSNVSTAYAAGSTQFANAFVTILASAALLSGAR